MTPEESFFASQIERWASRQLADYDAHNPGMLFAEGIVLSVAEAYELQSAVARLRCRRGERIVGYKIGCTSSSIRAQLGIDHCITGRLYESERHLSGVTLSRTEFANLAIEGELAIELSRQPTEDDLTRGGIPACVARVFPVIELHHYAMRGEQPSAGELIANNGLHAGFVAGPGVSPTDAAGDASLAIFADDRVIDECAGHDLIQTIGSSLKWLMQMLRERGDRLYAGQIILTGSIPSLFPIREDCRIRVEAPPFGSVDARVV